MSLLFSILKWKAPIPRKEPGRTHTHVIFSRKWTIPFKSIKRQIFTQAAIFFTSFYFFVFHANCEATGKYGQQFTVRSMERIPSEKAYMTFIQIHLTICLTTLVLK